MQISPCVALLLLASFVSLKAEIICPDVSDGEMVFFPSDENCGEFFQCAHGVSVRMECPDGLYWDQSREL